jgi:hypothetical protein
MAKLNCWEYKKCGREVINVKLWECGICPATVETKVDGVNGGKNGGRACWAIAGTLCIEDCSKCDFYKLVKEEEGLNWKGEPAILEKLLPREKFK